MTGLLTYTYLQPLFFPVGMEIAIVALNTLSIGAALVGLSLGVLLPLIWPGLTFGVALALLIGALATISNNLYFPITSIVLAALGAIISAR